MREVKSQHYEVLDDLRNVKMEGGWKGGRGGVGKIT